MLSFYQQLFSLRGSALLYNKCCVVEYDGSRFCGWQVQRNARTVQEEIEKALFKMYKKRVTIVGSGRTDSGVHSVGQVFNYRADFYIENRSVQMGLNSLLPNDITISSVTDVDESFNAMRSAKNKTYRYTILNRSYPSALMRDRSWWIRKEIVPETLNELFEPMVGEHDFTSFCIRDSLLENTVRTVNSIKISDEAPYLQVYINGNGFLHMMVRLMVGTVVEASLKGLNKKHIKEVLDKKNIKFAGAVAPAGGLTLYSVFYK